MPTLPSRHVRRDRNLGRDDPRRAEGIPRGRQGAFVGFDRQGGPGDSNQVPAMMTMPEAGYADKLLFS